MPCMPDKRVCGERALPQAAGVSAALHGDDGGAERSVPGACSRLQEGRKHVGSRAVFLGFLLFLVPVPRNRKVGSM
jgi:hypothetical protein